MRLTWQSILPHKIHSYVFSLYLSLLLLFQYWMIFHPLRTFIPRTISVDRQIAFGSTATGTRTKYPIFSPKFVNMCYASNNISFMVSEVFKETPQATDIDAVIESHFCALKTWIHTAQSTRLGNMWMVSMEWLDATLLSWLFVYIHIWVGEHKIEYGIFHLVEEVSIINNISTT